jgi:hypothetical protein
MGFTELVAGRKLKLFACGSPATVMMWLLQRQDKETNKEY